jgi:hypothetical protein
MDAAVRVRSVVWVATTIVLTLVFTLLVTQALSVGAAPGDEDSTFVPVSPCRLFDTRPGQPPSSGKKTPLAAGDSNVHTQQVTGAVGNCVIPTGALEVSHDLVGTTSPLRPWMAVDISGLFGRPPDDQVVRLMLISVGLASMSKIAEYFTPPANSASI